jgi:hypothetical protein
MTKTMVKVAALILAVAPAALAQQKVDLSKSADPRGRVSIDNSAGSTRVIGWDRPEITVTGTLGHGAEGVRLSGGPARTEIEVEPEGMNPHGVRCDLEIHVPAGSRLRSSPSAPRSRSGVTSSRAESVVGAISIGG